MKIRLSPGAVAPSRAWNTDAGLDLCARLPDGALWLSPGTSYKIPLGVAVELPERHVGLLVLRSSMGKLLCMPNGVGIIDEQYRGEICALVTTVGNNVIAVEPGARIAQLVIVPCITPPLEFVEELSDTPRGDGGFGSTNAKEVK